MQIQPISSPVGDTLPDCSPLAFEIISGIAWEECLDLDMNVHLEPGAQLRQFCKDLEKLKLVYYIGCQGWECTSMAMSLLIT